MKLKEIKPGMVIHWKTEDEKVALLEELERLRYEFYGTYRKPTYACDDGDLGHVIHVYNDNGWKNITQSDNLNEVTHEFSDLIIPEMSAEEVLQLANEICKHTDHCADCPMRGSCYKAYDSDKGKTVEVLSKWKLDHDKKEPEIEWFWKSYVVGGSDFKEADTEQEAMEWCEYYAKEHPEAKCTYKHVCRVKAVE